MILVFAKFNIQLKLVLFYNLLILLFLTSSASLHAQDVSVDKTVVMKAVPGLKYDVPRVTAAPGSAIRIRLQNMSEMPHNLLIVEPGTRKRVLTRVKAMGEKGAPSDYIPSSTNVLAAIPLLSPDESSSVILQVPDQKGVYPYVCTYPSHGIIMYGALYVTNNPDALPPLTKDPNIPETHKGDVSGRRAESPHPYPMEMPQVSRLFMPDASPAAIAVGMEGSQSYCWDAGDCYLRYAWEGGFIDASEQWDAKATELAEIEGEIYVHNETGFPFRIGHKDSIPKPEFKGYKLVDGYPRFEYEIGEITVAEFIQPLEKGTGLTITYRLENVDQPLWYARFGGNNVEVETSTGSWEGDYLKLCPDDTKEFTITITSK
jgi:plastocyanin